MAVQADLAVNRYDGNDVTVTFAYDFRILINSDLKVTVDAVVLDLGPDYSVTGANSATGGNVIFVVAPPAGNSNVVIERNIPLTQDTVFPEGTKFPTRTVETALDKCIMIDQQLSDEIGRAIILQPYAVEGGEDFKIAENASTRSGRVIVFTANGLGVTIGPDLVALNSALNGVNAAVAASQAYAANSSNSANSSAASAVLSQGYSVTALAYANDAQNSANTSEAFSLNSANSAANSLAYSLNSANSASNSQNSATNSANSASNSANSASNSANSASNSANSASDASNSADDAANSAANAAVTVSNAGVAINTITELNFIQGNNITLTFVDDGANNKVDITIASTGGGGGGGGDVSGRGLNGRYFDPVTTSFDSDDFMSGTSGAFTTGIGQLGWFLNQVGSGDGDIEREEGHPGIEKLTTGGAANSASFMYTPTTASPGAVAFGDNFDMQFIFKATKWDANTQLRIGLTSNVTNFAGGAFFEWNFADSSLYGVLSVASTPTRVIALTTPVNNTWYVGRIYRDGTDIKFSIEDNTITMDDADGPAGSQTLSREFWIANDIADTKQLWVDYCDMMVTGLDRANSAATTSATYVEYTSTDTLGAFDKVVELSGASFVFTLMTAVGQSGRVVTITHRGTSYSQVYTITGDGSEDIIGETGTANTYALSHNGESVTLVSDGADWRVISHTGISGRVLLASQTASNVAVLDFTDLVGYYSYEFVMTNVSPVAGSAGLYLEVSEDNGSTFMTGGSDYRWCAIGCNQSGASGVANSAASSAFLIQSTVHNSGSIGVTGTLWMNDLADNSIARFAYYNICGFDGAGLFGSTTGAGAMSSVQPISAVRFLFDTGNIAFGTIKCYGIRR